MVLGDPQIENHCSNSWQPHITSVFVYDCASLFILSFPPPLPPTCLPSSPPFSPSLLPLPFPSPSSPPLSMPLNINHTGHYGTYLPTGVPRWAQLPEGVLYATITLGTACSRVGVPVISCLLPALRWVPALGGHCLFSCPMAGPACTLPYTSCLSHGWPCMYTAIHFLPKGPENLGQDLQPPIPPLSTPLQAGSILRKLNTGAVILPEDKYNS